MAVARPAPDESEFVEFLAGDTPTAIPLRFCFPIDQVEKIALAFLANGGRLAAVDWEEI
jgi:hypothetical protein